MKIINNIINFIGSKNLSLIGTGVSILSVSLLLIFIVFNVSTVSIITGVILGNLLTIGFSYLKEKGDSEFKVSDIIMSATGSFCLSGIILLIYLGILI